MRREFSHPDPRIAFWSRQLPWPEDSPTHMFLGNVVHLVGRSLYGETWTGNEPSTILLAPLPEALHASIGTVELCHGCRLLFDYDTVYRARCPGGVEFLENWPIPTVVEWVRVVAISRSLADDRQKVFSRFIEVGHRLVHAFKYGDVRTATRAFDGGYLVRRAARADQIPQFEPAGSMAANLLKAFAGHAELLNKLKRGGEQTVRVEHVHVHPGGQAIVGNVTTGAGATKKLGTNPMHPNFRDLVRLRLTPRCGAKTRHGSPCRSPAVKDRARCRMLGGAAGSGAPAGKANGAYRHGRQTEKARADRREITAWLSIMRAAARDID